MSTNRSREREPNLAPVERWMSRPAGGDQPEDRFASLIRAAEPPAGLAPVARARVWSRLRKRPPARARLARLRWSIALGLLLTSGVVLGALSARRWLTAKPAPVVRASTPAKPAGARRLAAAAPQPTPPPDVPPPTDEPPPTDVPPPHAARPTRASVPPRPHDAIVATSPLKDAAPVTPAAASALSGETPLLGEALTRLRQKHDARGALASLDEYRARFPGGAFKREAEGARIDALLMLGRNDEALAELRAVTFRPVGRDQELRLIRGELSAAADCAAAVADFERVLAEKPPLPLVERALHGRAACRLRLGDEAGALQDLSEYLRRFPDGRFAPEARRIRGGL